MGELNIQKGNDPNAAWIASNGQENQKIQNAKTVNQSNYVSSIVQSQTEDTAQLNQEAGNPKLPLPAANAGDAGQALYELYSPQSLVAGLKAMPQMNTPGASPEMIEKYGNDSVSDPEIQQLAKQLNLPAGVVQKNLQSQYHFSFEQAVNNGVSPEEAHQLIFANYFPELAENLSPSLKALLTKFQDQTSGQLNKAYGFPQNWEPPEENAEFTQSLNNEFTSTFDSVLNNTPGLSLKQMASLRTMFFMPNTNASTDLKTIFNNLMQQATNLMQEKYGLPADYQFTTDSQSYNLMLQGGYQKNLQQNLNNYTPALTAQQKAMVQQLIENPSLASSMPPEIQQLADEIKTLSLSQIQDKFGVPKSWVPATQKLSSPYFDTKTKNMAQKGINQGKEMYVRLAQMFGLTPFSELQGDSEGSNGAPTSNAASTSNTSSTSNAASTSNTSSTSNAASALNTVKEMLASFTQDLQTSSSTPQTGGTSAQTPAQTSGQSQQTNSVNNQLGSSNTLSSIFNSPEQAIYVDYLKALGLSLIKVENMIYMFEATTSQSAKNLANAKMQTELDGIAKQQAQANEIKEKQGKQINLGPLSSIMGWISNIFVLVIAILLVPVTGGASLALAMTYLIDQIQAQARGTTPLFQQLFQKIQSALGSPAGEIVDLILVFLLSGGNPLLIASLLQESQVVENGVKMLGGNEMAQAIVSMVVQMLIQLVTTVIMMVMTGGIDLPAEAAEFMEGAYGIAADVAMVLAKVLSIVFDVVTTSLQVTQSAVDIDNEVLQAEIIKLQAEQEASAELVQAALQQLKTIIEKLLDNLNGQAGWLADIGQFQQQKYTQVSQITSQLAS